MSDDTSGRVFIPGRVDRDTQARTWQSWLPGILVTVGMGVIVTLGVSFGNRMVGVGDTSIQLTERLTNINEEVRDQKKMMQELLMQARNLYTRDEAQRDREAAERRFQSMEGRIGELGRRMELLENIYRSPGPVGRGLR